MAKDKLPPHKFGPGHDIDDICYHEHLNMKTRRLLGYAQHDDHVWRWLNYYLKLWSEAHPIRIIEDIK